MTFFGAVLRNAVVTSASNTLKAKVHTSASKEKMPELFRENNYKLDSAYVPGVKPLNQFGALDRTALAFESKMAQERRVFVKPMPTISVCPRCHRNHDIRDCKKA